MNDVQIKKLRSHIQAEPLFRILKQTGREAGEEAYLVGGLIRDWMLGRQSRDVDLTLPHKALDMAHRFSERTGGTFVLLHKEAATARVVLPGWTFDFAKFRGPDLTEDLKGRDFTVNAIAFSLPQAFEEGVWTPVDPLSGLRDLQERLLRMAGPDAFSRDPLRLLRAFRLTAQHGLTFEAGTRQAIQRAAPLLTRSAPERIHYEWNLLLSQPGSTASIRDMDRLGLLAVLFPELKAIRGLKQPGCPSLDAFQHSLLTLQYLEELLRGDRGLPQALRRALQRYCSRQGVPPVLKWAALFQDLGKPDRTHNKKEPLNLHGQEEFSEQRIALLARRLRLSNHEKEAIGRLIALHRRPLTLLGEAGTGTPSRRVLVRFIKDASHDLSGIFLLALAGSLASQREVKPADQEILLKKLWSQALCLQEEVVRLLEKKESLLSGFDIIEEGLKPGPLFKKILASLEEDFLAGEFATREEGLARLKKLLRSGEPTV
jgi:poly(A) polymerase